MKVALFIFRDFYMYYDIADEFVLDVIQYGGMIFLRTKFFILYELTNEDFIQSKDNPTGEYIRVYQYEYIIP